MSAPLTRKRARTDVDEEPQDTKPDPANLDASLDNANPPDLGEAGQLKKDEEFWFDDGTVILHAGNIEFRVYRGLLETHSTVLAELFAQPHSRRPVSIDGECNALCPVVKLSDSPHDVRHVLRCCMPRQSGSPFATVTVTPSFHLVSAAVRLGHKYKIDDMYQKGVTLLKSHYTNDFYMWQSKPLGPPIGWLDIHAIGVINLARLTGELSLLPAAFLVCVLALDADLVRGFTREDGSREHLTLDDIGLCFQARTRLREASLAALFRVLRTLTTVPTCNVLPQCSSAIKDGLRTSALEADVNRLITGDAFLSTVDVYFKAKDNKATLCQACIDAINEWDEEENLAVWDRLPELLGIEVPGWRKPVDAPASASATAI